MRPHALILTLALLTAGQGLLAQELKERATFEGEPRPVALSPDGRMVAIVIRKRGEAQVKLLDVASGKEVTTFVCQTHGLQALAFSPDGRFLAAAGYDPVMVWDVSARKQLATLKGRVTSVYALAFSPDSKKLGAAGATEAQLWEVTSGKELSFFRRRIPVHSGTFAVIFSNDLRTLISPDYQEIDLWDVETGKRRATLSEHRGRVWCAHYSSDGKTLVAASILDRGRMRQVGDIRLWDVATGRERAVFQEGIGFVWFVRLSSDGKTLAALDGGDLKLLEVATGKQRLLRPPPDHRFTSIDFATDGRLFVVGTPDHKAIKIWEVEANGRR